MHFSEVLQLIKDHFRGEDAESRFIPPETILDAEIIGVGRGRLVIVDSTDNSFVLKIPLSFSGALMNLREVSRFKSNDQSLGEGRLAQCDMILIEGLECLLLNL